MKNSLKNSQYYLMAKKGLPGLLFSLGLIASFGGWMYDLPEAPSKSSAAGSSVTAFVGGPNDICINLFNDYNSNGVDDGVGETGISGLTVTAYDAANTPTVLTDNGDGSYVFTPGNADVYRVEVTGLPQGLEPSVSGATTVVFTSRGTPVSIALHYPEEYYADSGVFMAIPCYVDGPSNGPNAGGDVLVVLPTDELTGGIGNQFPTEYFIADHSQIGATFGVAYSRPAESLFAAAFTKRHSAFGPVGTGSIYKVDLTSTMEPITSSMVSTFIDLNALFGANTAGANPHPDAGTDFNRDPLTYDAVGKVGLGGLALSENDNSLWTINLADRRLYEMPLGGSVENPTAPAAGDINRWPATGDLTDLPGLPGTAAERDQNIRPFAVKYYRDAIYIGLVATGESSVTFNAATSTVTNTGDRSLMRGYVYKFDPATDVFTQVLDFPMNYPREQAIDFCANNAQAEFNPWAPVYDMATFEAAVMGTSTTSGTLLPERSYPQPWITDIEFDEFGKMVIGIRDRFADQHGFNKLPPSTAGSDPNTPFNADAAGDVLVASINITDNTTYVIENNAANGPNGAAFGPSMGAGFGEGPGGGEFYFDDRYRPANASADGGGACSGANADPNDMDPPLDPTLEQGHDEIAMGGLFQYNGSLTLYASVYDPILDFDNFNQAGVVSLNSESGARQEGALVYTTQDFDNGTNDDPNTFGKGNGLGDVEGVSPPAPIEVGNRLWVDENGNGRQDADEEGINGVLVELFLETSPGVFTKVAETTTAANSVQGDGFYIFSDDTVAGQNWEPGFTEVEPEMNYEVRIALANIQSVEADVTAFTTGNFSADVTNDRKMDLNDSDASPAGVISFSTGMAGENNHTLDFGVVNCNVIVNSVTPSACDPLTNEYSLDVSVTYAGAPVGDDILITTNNGASQTFTPANVSDTETFTLTGLNSDGMTGIIATAGFANATICSDQSDPYAAPEPCDFVFDLALVKRLDLTANPGPFAPGGTVTFSITVYNQGETDATDIEVKDYVPEGLSLAPASAPDWTVSVDTAILNRPFSLAAGMENTLSISFLIDADFMGDTLVNRAEISSFDDDNDPTTAPPIDEDSTPDDNGMDAPEAATPDEFEDDGVGTPGTMDNPNDEDDYDWEGIAVIQSFDLALVKRIDTNATPGPFTNGSTVTFVIEVKNQGSLDATDVEVADYIPDGLTLVPSATWTQDVDTARLATAFALAAGDTETLSITFTIDDDFAGTMIDNVAEVSAARNLLGLPDEDSTPGDNGNDDPEIDTDDEEDDDGPNGNGIPDNPDDADDFDLARLTVSTVSLGSTVFLDNNNDGTQNGADTGIAGVTVQLFDAATMMEVLTDAAGTRVLVPADAAPTLTDADGNYLFDNLLPGDYYVVVTSAPTDAPISSNNAGIPFMETDPDDNLDNDDDGLQPGGGGMSVTSGTITLSPGSEPVNGTVAMSESAQGNMQDDASDNNGNMTLDFGFFAPVSVGDTAFVDLDGDGLQTPGEPGVGGVTVTLLDGNGDIVTVDAEGNAITGVTMTAADGSYGFANLPPGSYSVVFDISTADNAEFYDFTMANATGDDSNDSDNSIALTDVTAQSDPTGFLNSGEMDLTLDVGVACNLSVVVAEPFTICATQTINLTDGIVISPDTTATFGATWTTPDGEGDFLDAAGNVLADPYRYGSAVTYRPAPADALRGSITLILTTDDPAGPCEPVSDAVTIALLKVDCGQFFWGGN